VISGKFSASSGKFAAFNWSFEAISGKFTTVYGFFPRSFEVFLDVSGKHFDDIGKVYGIFLLI